MKYYQVKPEHDQKDKFIYVGHSNLLVKHDGILIGNELYTPRERERIAVSDKYFNIIDVPKKYSYYFFGARFNPYSGGMIEYNEHGQKIQ
jgi:hypothetical protein